MIHKQTTQQEPVSLIFVWVLPLPLHVFFPHVKKQNSMGFLCMKQWQAQEVLQKVYEGVSLAQVPNGGILPTFRCPWGLKVFCSSWMSWDSGS